MASNMTAPAPATGAMPDIPDFLRRDQPSWRNTLKIHPACELIPPVSDADLDALGDDILANGLTAPIALTPDGLLLDGRSRLDALERKGVKVSIYTDEWSLALEGRADKQAFERVHRTIGIMIIRIDPVAYVISANLHRRHLTAEQKRDLIAKLLKAEPAKSDRQIGKMVKADHKTVGAVRAKKEACGEIPHVEERKDTKGRAQPAKKAKTDQIERDRKACIALNQKVVEAEEERAQFTCSCPACMSRGSHEVSDAETPPAETAAKRAFFAQRIRNALARGQSDLKGMFDAVGEIGLTEVILADFLENTPHTAETHAIVRKWLDAGEAAS